LPVEKQVAIIFAGTRGLVDDLAVEDIRAFEGALYRFLDESRPGILQQIRDKKQLDDGLQKELTDAINELKGNFTKERQQRPAAAGARA